ncbi:MAG: signal peptidase II [Candidatus Omnitrophica bacterium]|nr:signal peptidase II [Candidatus Omnitrophota bacterium]
MRLPWIISALTLATDQVTKFVVAASCVPGQRHPLFPPVLSLTYVQNTGAAFGMLKGLSALLIVISLLVVGWLTWEVISKPALPRLAQWGSGLIIGGAVGNLIDRLRFGYVIDFIDVRVWPVFNIGDSAITIGVSLLIWYSLRRR